MSEVFKNESGWYWKRWGIFRTLGFDISERIDGNEYVIETISCIDMCEYYHRGLWNNILYYHFHFIWSPRILGIPVFHVCSYNNEEPNICFAASLLAETPYMNDEYNENDAYLYWKNKILSHLHKPFIGLTHGIYFFSVRQSQPIWFSGQAV